MSKSQKQQEQETSYRGARLIRSNLPVKEPLFPHLPPPAHGSVVRLDDSPSALQTQQGGSHYKTLKIQPVEYVHANNIPFIEGCVIKYVTRWRTKNDVEDLRKAIHFLELLIELEEKANRPRS